MTLVTSFMKKHLWWILPTFLLAAIAPLTPYLDMSFESYFYHQTQPPGFHINAFCNFMFKYAIYPAQLTALMAFLVFTLSFFVNVFKIWQRPALALTATMAIGAGFITHTVFKDHWGRPRPKQVIEFGGHQAFRPFYKPNIFHQPEPSKSFPCGHCTMGFYFFSVALLCRRLQYRSLFYFFFVFAMAFGLAFGIARMKMGAHFFSDVLATAVIMWLTAYIFDITLCKNWKSIHERPH